MDRNKLIESIDARFTLFVLGTITTRQLENEVKELVNEFCDEVKAAADAMKETLDDFASGRLEMP
jgi:hypothetical protein